MAESPLVLGPMLRHVDETSASIWVETRAASTVRVRAGGREWHARTFRVHDHHYALVEVDGLEPDTVLPYEVQVDGVTAWPDPDPESDEDIAFPGSVIATRAPGRRLRLAYGSCRTSVPHDSHGNRTHGVDAMRAFALAMAAGDEEPPDLLLFLGDQVYADLTSKQMQDFIRSRRDIHEEPGKELKDYEEYAHLYRLAWSDGANRWLLSTVPTAMIFDDHDVRDDWNASFDWKQEMEATSWWHGRIVAGLGSYWVYQHLGNLSPSERAEDELWQRVVAHERSGGQGELDLSDALDAFADRSDRDPTSVRWSYARDLDDVRLIVVDSRAARDLTPSARGLLDRDELAWFDEQLRGGFRQVIIATSLPFLLPMGLHHVEAWDEAISQGAWGRPAARIGERLRQAVDLEHWAAWENTFQAVARMVSELADGARGPAPQNVLFLSGDVHYSYLAEVERGHGGRILQAVCSPVRNPLPRFLRWFAVVMSYGVATPVGAAAARSVKVPDAPFEWHTVKGPWFDNNLALLRDGPDGLLLTWNTGVVDHGDERHPRLKEVASITVPADRDVELSV
ncbi:alkaline phosphatase D family protein [Agromyces sp. NPDC056523]|uniref:alkaline phosphatase D family protein n=1 Tax=Agromyces sp. NPDC056523 TaxID=3345850 RepID=UPI00366C4B7E